MLPLWKQAGLGNWNFSFMEDEAGGPFRVAPRGRAFSCVRSPFFPMPIFSWWTSPSCKCHSEPPMTQEQCSVPHSDWPWVPINGTLCHGKWRTKETNLPNPWHPPKSRCVFLFQKMFFSSYIKRNIPSTKDILSSITCSELPPWWGPRPCAINDLRIRLYSLSGENTKTIQ